METTDRKTLKIVVVIHKTQHSINSNVTIIMNLIVVEIYQDFPNIYEMSCFNLWSLFGDYIVLLDTGNTVEYKEENMAWRLFLKLLYYAR